MVMDLSESEREIILHLRKSFGSREPKEIKREVLEKLWAQNITALAALRKRIANTPVTDKLYQPLVDKSYYHELRIMQLSQQLDLLRKGEKQNVTSY